MWTVVSALLRSHCLAGQADHRTRTYAAATRTSARQSRCPRSAMVYSVPQQVHNEKGVEGLPQTMSRLNNSWYTTSNSGAGTTSGTLKLPRESTYIERAIPDDQRTEALAWKTAHLWKSNPANAMQLPDALSFADESGDGLIDKEEFKALMQKAGAVGDVNKLFAEIDDGDGLLTAAEVRKLADRNRNKFKAQN